MTGNPRQATRGAVGCPHTLKPETSFLVEFCLNCGHVRKSGPELLEGFLWPVSSVNCFFYKKTNNELYLKNLIIRMFFI